MARRNPEAERKAKEKKQKIILAVGGVILLALLGLQGPKTMAKLSQKPPDLPGEVLPPNGLPPGQTTPPLAAPTLAGGNAGGGATIGGGASGGNPAVGDGPASKLAVFEIAPDPVQGQLRSFTRFVSKDPFQQQLEVDANGNQVGGGSSSPSSGSGGVGSGGAGSGSLGGSSGGRSAGGGSAGGGSTGGSSPPTAVSAVKISINGAAPATVSVGSDFPAGTPLFHLLAATAVVAKVTIAGGAYADGRSAVTLRAGKAVTLENTADGTRYTLLLVGPG